MGRALIPFFVADRPASLKILKGIMLRYPEIKVGIMTHAFISKNFTQMFNDFPNNSDLQYEEKHLLDNESTLARNLMKMADSGIFSKNGCTIGYEELFERYNTMGTDFGVMIDVLGDAKATLKSAEKALRIYEKNKKEYRFDLVAVAQGRTLEEYLECYRKLFSNFEFIAIGGLLKKRIKSARYVRVRDEQFMYEVLQTIRQEFNPEWLYVLGCYHPSRHKKFEEMGIWGSDYKGWIFNYKLKRQLLAKISLDLLHFEQENGLSSTCLSQVIQKEEQLQIKEREWREAKNSILKRTLWIEANQLRKELEAANKRLLKERKNIASSNHFPPEYRHKLAIFENILEKEEQFLRFQQVRRYIEEKIYGQFQ